MTKPIFVYSSSDFDQTLWTLSLRLVAYIKSITPNLIFLEYFF
jgi:hypothetical protein